MTRITIYVKWAEFKEFPGYYISNNGMFRKGANLQKIFHNNSNGRPFVFVSKKELGRMINKRFDLHFLVWSHFGATEKVKGSEIHHKDFNPYNNNIDNLVYMPKHEHLRLHGCTPNKSLPG